MKQEVQKTVGTPPKIPGLEQDFMSAKRQGAQAPDDDQVKQQLLTELFRDRSLFDQLQNEKSRRFEGHEEEEVLNAWLGYVHQLYNNIVLDSFYGILLNQLVCCTCGAHSFRFSLFSGLQVDLKHFVARSKATNFVPIEKLVGHCFSSDYEDKESCSKCRLQTIHQKSLKVYRHPKALIIDLQKEEDCEKRNTFIKLNKTSINLDDFSAFAGQGEYFLRGFVSRDPGLAKRPPQALQVSANKAPDNFALTLHDDFELVYYSDSSRSWVHHSSGGRVTLSPDPKVLDGSNHLSYCVYEFGKH